MHSRRLKFHDNDSPLLTAADAAKVLGVDAGKITTLLNDGTLPCVRTAHGIAILGRHDVEAYAAELDAKA